MEQTRAELGRPILAKLDPSAPTTTLLPPLRPGVAPSHGRGRRRGEQLAADALGNVATVHARLIVWCWDCRHQVEPDPAEMTSATAPR